MPVWVQKKVPVVAEVNVIEARTVPDPEASAKRPVQPVTVKEAVRVNAPG